MTARLFIAAALMCAATSASAQVRDTARAPVGNASISGVVMSATSADTPIRRVAVTLSGGVISMGSVAITDDAGVFRFDNLPAGTYTLVATRPAYVPSAYGAKTFGRGSGVPVSVEAGQRVTGITICMIHGSVIAGAVRDPLGRPAAGVDVIVLSVQNVNGRRRTTPLLQQSRTDGRGEYRVFGLAPGDYIVRAQPTGRFDLGGGTGMRQTTAAEVEWAKTAAAKSNAAPGAATETPAPPPPPAGRPIAYAPTYFPGSVDSAQATIVSVGPNEERSGIDFATTLVPVASISGTVIGPDGQPPRNAQVQLMPAQGTSTTSIDTLMGLVGAGGGVRVSADGRLSASGIAPGRYRLLARGALAGSGPAGPSLPGGAGALAAGMAASMFGGRGGGPTLWAAEDLVIDGRDITGLTLQLQTGSGLSGKIVFEGDDPQSPADASRVTVTANDASRESHSALDMFAGMLQGSAGGGAKDGTFNVSGLAPGSYRVSFGAPGNMAMFGISMGSSPWVLKSAMLGDIDVADAAIDVRAGQDVTGIVATFTKAATQISGRLQDAAGRPVSGFPIVVFPADRARWSPGSRRIVSAKPASDGTYKVTGLPAGDYFLCALTDLDPNDLYDAAFLDQLVAGALKITLADGEKKVQDLRLGSGS